MSSTVQNGNGVSATIWGTFGRLAIAVVLGVALCLGISVMLGAGCGGQKEDAANTAKQTAETPVVSQPSTTPVGETTPTTQPVVAEPVPQQPPVQAETPVVATKKPVTTKQPAAPKPAPVTTSAAPAPPQDVVLAVGTVLESTLQTTLATDKNAVGDPVTLRTASPVVVESRTVVPAGSTVHGQVTHVRAAGRFKGAAEITVRFTELELASGERLPITCEPLRRVSKGDGKETATEIGAGAVVGGALGGVLGGKDDVLKGAAVGAALGTGVAGATKGQQVVLPAGQTVKITLTAPLSVGAKVNS